MDCLERDQAAAFVHAQLDGEASREVEVHLAHCRSCRKSVAEAVRDSASDSNEAAARSSEAPRADHAISVLVHVCRAMEANAREEDLSTSTPADISALGLLAYRVFARSAGASFPSAEDLRTLDASHVRIVKRALTSRAKNRFASIEALRREFEALAQSQQSSRFVGPIVITAAIVIVAGIVAAGAIAMLRDVPMMATPSDAGVRVD